MKINKRDKSGRLVYTPELFKNTGKHWTINELIDLVGYDQTMKREKLGLMLERTPGTCSSKISRLKKNGEYEFYLKNLIIEEGNMDILKIALAALMAEKGVKNEESKENREKGNKNK